ncbi:MAG TPA: hypothetical protein PKK31_08845 [Elusimicrobiales bacterium]|nr:hypothetical protein [Elusimicrobiales bacterium]
MKGIFFSLLLSAWAAPAFAAVGCDLNDPDRDVERLFPSSTGYKVRYLTVKGAGGEAMLARIEKRLGDRFKGLYETIDVPYTVYDIYRGTEPLGHIHGVNQKGQFGGIQVFLALDKSGTIRSFYIQKLTSRAAKDLRSKEFGAQFEGLALPDFSGYDPVRASAKPGTPAASLKAPERAAADFPNVMRAVKKNLILMDELVFTEKKK